LGTTPPPAGEDRERILGELEDYVKDALLVGTDDYVLNIVIDLVMAERDGKPLFNPIDEPFFFRRFVRPWILTGIKERDTIENIKKKAI
jgi:hypothetical protein